MRVIASAFTVVLLLTACAASSPAKTDFDESINFSKYQAFSWLSENPMKVGKSVEAPRERLQPIVMEAIRSSLEAKGHAFVANRGDADYLVSFTVGSRASLTLNEAVADSDSRSGRGGWATAYYGGAAGGNYTQGVLAIDIHDADDNYPVWHGVAGRTLSSADQEDPTQLVDDIVQTILANFPPE